MKKLVFCEFAGRRKKVIFETQSGESDVSNLRKALVKASETDKDLRDRMANHNLVFQYIDLELCSQPIDIDDGDIIEAKSILTIVFTPTVLLDIPIIEIIDVPIFDIPIIEISGTSIEQELLNTNICDEKCDFYEEDPVKTTKEVSNSSSAISTETSSKTETTTVQSNISTEVIEIQCDSPEVIPGPSKVQSTEVTAKKTLSIMPLPVLPDRLASCNNLLDHINEFVRVCSTHLLSLTNGKPTASDYLKLSMAICTEYPILKDIDFPTYYGSFKRKLSNCIRNRRAFLKRKILSQGSDSAKKAQRTTTQMCAIPSSSKNILPYSTADDDAAKNDMADADMGSLMAKLIETKPSVINLQHMKLLMSKTIELRRDWIIKENTARCSTILQQFPYLKNSELLQHDFDLLGIWKNNATQNFNILLEKLSKYFKIKNTTTESDKLSLLMKTEKVLISNKVLISCKTTVRKINESFEILKTEENETPRLAIFLDGPQISQAFIVADKEVELEIQNPTVVSCMRCLMGMYYVCDIAYPASYKNFMHLFDYEVMGVPKPKILPITFCTFVNKLNNLK